MGIRWPTPAFRLAQVTTTAIVLGVLACLGLATAQAPQGVLRIAMQVEPSTMDPRTTLVGRRGDFTFAFFDNLVQFDEDMNFKPGLARDWERVEPTRYRFYLHDGIRTHAGYEVDAQFIKDWHEDIWRMDPPASQQTYLQRAEVEVVDRLTVDFVLAVPDREWLTFFAQPHLPVWDVRHRDDVGPEEFGRSPSGTGPFRFERWEPGSRIVAVANEDYFLGPPKVAEVHFEIIPDVATQLIALERDEVDVISAVPDHEVERINRHPQLSVAVVEETRTGALALNLEDPILSDVLVRRALGHAMDRDEIVEALGIAANPVDGVVHRGVLGHKPGLVFEHDPDLAEAMLNEAGWFRNQAGRFEKDGQVLQLEIRTARGRYTLDYELCEMVQLQLAAFGVPVSIAVYESAAWLEMVYAAAANPNPTHQAVPLFYGIRTGIPFEPFLNKFGTGGRFNAGHHSSARFDDLLSIARSTQDDHAMFAALDELQEIIFGDALEWVFFTVNIVYAHNDRVNGFVLSPAQNISMHEVSLD